MTSCINASEPSVVEKTERQEDDVIIYFVLSFLSGNEAENYTVSELLSTTILKDVEDGESDKCKVLKYDIKVDITSDRDIDAKVQLIDYRIDNACMTYKSVTIGFFVLTDNESPFSTYLFFAKRTLKFLEDTSAPLYKVIKYKDSFIQTLYCNSIKAVGSITEATTSAVKNTEVNNTASKIGRSLKNDDKPNKIQAQISAILSHYVYFYMDWLEVYWSDYTVEEGQYSINNDSEKITQKKKHDDYELSNDAELVKSVIENNGFPFISLKTLGVPGTASSKIKVKMRVVSRINEILNIAGRGLKCGDANGTITDKEKTSGDPTTETNVDNGKTSGDSNTEKNKDKEKTSGYSNAEKYNIVHRILATCAARKAPIDFFELYNECGYWKYLEGSLGSLKGLVAEAKLWHVCHPMVVAKKHNIGMNIKDRFNRILRKNSSGNEKKDAVLDIGSDTEESCERKDVYGHCKLNYKIKIGKEQKEQNFDFYYTQLLHTGIDRVSGYGGALFVRHLDDPKNESGLQFIYATKGTDFNSLNDWILVDVLQAFTGFSLQHVHTIVNAHNIDYNIHRKYDDKVPLIFVGHSLGGGLASANAIIAEGRYAITFNAAGLNFIGSVATKAIGAIAGHNWNKIKDAFMPLRVAERVYPIRIEGETIDVLQIIGRLLSAGTCERAYGKYPLIYGKTKGAVAWGHGMNNFLYARLLNDVDIVNQRTRKVEIYGKVIMAPADLSNVVFVGDKDGRIYFNKGTIKEMVKLGRSSKKK